MQYECIKDELRDNYNKLTKNSIRRLLQKAESDPSLRLMNNLALIGKSEELPALKQTELQKIN